ncbi:MAG: endonuclease MutS2 [Acutalibacteraceae bacterium]|nr:endonuclease MutS2 [Acutalibacteraceae bacterium]
MKLKKRYYKNLELDKILELLAMETTVAQSSEMALALTPKHNINDVKKLLDETQEAYTMTAKFSAPSFGRIENVSPIVSRAVAGSVLTIPDFLKISEALRVIRSVKGWRENFSSEEYFALDEYFNVLFPNRYFEDKINFIIKSEDEINDNASQTLSEIRRKMKSISLNIRNRFDKLIKDSSTNRYLQDGIITQRDGRYVVPVKSEHRGEVPGLVHDTSSTGATLFVEPMAVVELNNELRVLAIKEKTEIDRILMQLSAELADFASTVLSSYNSIVYLNLVFAKASLAYKMKATVPMLNDSGKIHLKNARHPLIDKNIIVPVTVSLGIDYDSLIITGPNTGGKTVTLKTVGLLTLMTMCGLMIPVDDNSSVSIFENILVDIGDEQSIEQSLSTFSSHMVNIISILEKADDKSLVLLDELGGGTDPVEGAALAKAILHNLYLSGAKILATTHYAELKAYALDTKGVENACFEFDVESLKPTYRLLVGIPGKSNAFDIAKALGLSQDIIDNAKNSLTEDDMRFERISSALEEARKIAENERNEATKLRFAIANEKEKIDSHLAEIEKKKEQIIAKSREDASRILEKTRYDSNLLLNSMEELKKNLNAQNNAEILAKAKKMAKDGINAIENIADPVDKNDTDYVLPRKLEIGDNVTISSFGRKGSVVKIDEKNKKVNVSSGNLNIWVDISDIRLCNNEKKEIPKTRNITGLKSRAKREVSGEIDIRGMACDEGIMEVDKYIDNAVLSGLETVRIIHGKGTGVLRSAVQSHLRKHKNVEGFRVGTFGEGENGVTVVTLKQ